MRILVIEDNPKMSGFIRKGLTEQGYAVDVARTGHDGEDMAATEPYDLILLDVMLPDQDGIQTVKNLRRRKIATPVLMLTALSATPDRIAGLDAGADDYLPKPFEFDELLARIRALLRRGRAQEASRLDFDDIELDLGSRKVTRAGTTIRLSTKEYALLEYFMRHPNRLLTRTSIGQHVWDMNFDSDSNVIDVYVSMLRRKMDKGFARRVIHTVFGAGYMLSLDDPGA